MPESLFAKCWKVRVIDEGPDPCGIALVNFQIHMQIIVEPANRSYVFSIGSSEVTGFLLHRQNLSCMAYVYPSALYFPNLIWHSWMNSSIPSACSSFALFLILDKMSAPCLSPFS